MPRYKKFRKKPIKSKLKNNDKISRLDKMKSGRTTRSTSTPTGDVNFDGSTDVIDVVMVVSHILEQLTLSVEQQAEADIEMDGIINMWDVLELINMIVDTELRSQAMEALKKLPDYQNYLMGKPVKGIKIDKRYLPRNRSTNMCCTCECNIYDPIQGWYLYWPIAECWDGSCDNCQGNLSCPEFCQEWGCYPTHDSHIYTGNYECTTCDDGGDPPHEGVCPKGTPSWIGWPECVKERWPHHIR